MLVHWLWIGRIEIEIEFHQYFLNIPNVFWFCHQKPSPTVLTKMTDLITDNLKARDASASKKLFLSALTRLHVLISEKKE